MFDEKVRPERPDEIDARKAWENLQSAKGWETIFEHRLSEANQASEKLGSKPFSMSSIHHAMSTGAGATDSAGDYLSSVAEYLEQYRPGNLETNEVRTLANEFKQIRGKLETDWETEGKNPDGYNSQKALVEIRGLFSRLRSINL